MLMLDWPNFTSLSGRTGNNLDQHLFHFKKTMDQNDTSFKGGDKYRSKNVCPIQVNSHQVGGVQEDRSKALRDDL